MNEKNNKSSVLQTILTELKTKHKLTDAKIADRVGLSQATITRLRNGTHKQCRYEYGVKIKRLGDEFGVEV